MSPLLPGWAASARVVRGGRARLAGLALVTAMGCAGSDDLTRAPQPQPTAAEIGAPAPAPLPNGRLPDTARPLRYELSLAIDPDKDRFTGDVVITLSIPAATRAVVLHGRDLTIGRAEALVDGRHVHATPSFRVAAGARDAPDELVLTFDRPLLPGRAELRVAYSAPLGDKLSGAYRVREGGARYVFTQLEPTEARRLLPCFDEPSFKVPFELKVITPKDNLVVANAEEVERRPSEDGKIGRAHV